MKQDHKNQGIISSKKNILMAAGALLVLIIVGFWLFQPKDKNVLNGFLGPDKHLLTDSEQGVYTEMISAGDWAKYIEYYDQEPHKNVVRDYFLAYALMQLGDYKTAIPYFDKTIRNGSAEYADYAKLNKLICLYKLGDPIYGTYAELLFTDPRFELEVELEKLKKVMNLDF